MFDVGKDLVKLREALQRSQDLFGNNATLLCDSWLPSSMIEICKSNGKEKGGPWECYNADEFYGWESNKVVAVTAGGFATLEMATRAKTQLILILAEPEIEAHKKNYADYQKYFQAAADTGLVELLVSANANESDNEVEEAITMFILDNEEDEMMEFEIAMSLSMLDNEEGEEEMTKRAIAMSLQREEKDDQI